MNQIILKVETFQAFLIVKSSHFDKIEYLNYNLQIMIFPLTFSVITYYLVIQ